MPPSDATSLPEIAGDYVEEEEWEHCVYLYKRYTIGQSGERVTLTLADEVWPKAPPERYEASGVIEKVYAEWPLVRLRFDDGTRRYFDLAARRLDDVAENLWLEVSVPSLDFHNAVLVRDILSVIDAMATVVDPGATSHAAEYGDRCWPPGANRRHTFAVGPRAGAHYLFDIGDITEDASHVTYEGLDDGQSVGFHCWPVGETSFRVYSARCLPERHRTLEELVRQRCGLLSVRTGTVWDVGRRPGRA